MTTKPEHIAYGPTPNDHEPIIPAEAWTTPQGEYEAKPYSDLLSDESIEYLCRSCSWDIYEALSYLAGEKSLGIEYEDELHGFFPEGLSLALEAAKAGKIGKIIERCGKALYIDGPKNWLAWADAQDRREIPISEKIRKAIENAPPPFGAD